MTTPAAVTQNHPAMSNYMPTIGKPYKPYFAKLLPVLGPVKSGDLFTHASKIYECIGTDDGRVWANLGESAADTQLAADPGDCQKVAIYLCSWDVKVGDKFTQIGIDARYPDARFTCVGHSKDGDLIDNEGRKFAPATVYKIIGLISPEATWVEKGMKFDEQQIRVMAVVQRKDGLSIHPDKFRTPMSGWLKSSFNTGEHEVTTEVEIKCPCCSRFT